jgi:hypothetical protein
VARNATGVRLAVDGQGRALLTFRERGRTRHLLAWGAVNARDSEAGRQTQFRLDYSGGWRSHGRELWRSFTNRCTAYDGPPLAWLVRACTAPDGSHWAVQSWQRMLLNQGAPASGHRAAWELRISHWRGAPAELEMGVDWAYGRYDHLFGRLTYRARPVYGHRATRAGAPLDGFGRNIYLDTLNSAYGPGWRRENSFLTHRGSGAFCYGVFPKQSGLQTGKGERYRATVIGPGVTPDIVWEGAAPGPFDRHLDSLANERIRLLGSQQCKPN